MPFFDRLRTSPTGDVLFAPDLFLSATCHSRHPVWTNETKEDLHAVHGKATKTFQILHVRGDRTIQLPNKGVVATYKRWSSGGSKNPGGKYFYHAEILGLKGFGFCISKDEKKRNDFARELAGFLGYEIQDQGKRE